MIYEDFKVHVNNPIYRVNKKHNAVTCIADLDISTPYSMGNGLFFDLYGEINKAPKTVVGTAFCSPNDEFDVEIGKRIAYARAENQAYRIMSEMVTKQLVNFNQLVSLSEKFKEKAKRCVSHNNNYIDALTNTENPSYKVLLDKRKNKENKR